MSVVKLLKKNYMKTYIQITILITTIVCIFLQSCKKEDNTQKPTPPSLPTVATDSVYNICIHSALCTISATSKKGEYISQYGICWSTSPEPNINDENIRIDYYTSNYTFSFSGLKPSTTYYIRAFAINAAGMAYSNIISFTTFSSTVKDNEGNTYNAIDIGNQIWMKENLKVSHYNNGDEILTTSSDISYVTEPKYQWPVNGNNANLALYGRLYTWYVTTDERGICPTGWHVPSEGDFNTLITNTASIYGNSIELLDSGDVHWHDITVVYPTSDTVFKNKSSNKSGFTALPGGYRRPTGEFEGFGDVAFYGTTEFDIDTVGSDIYYITVPLCPSLFDGISFIGFENGGREGFEYPMSNE